MVATIDPKSIGQQVPVQQQGRKGIRDGSGSQSSIFDLIGPIFGRGIDSQQGINPDQPIFLDPREQFGFPNRPWRNPLAQVFQLLSSIINIMMEFITNLFNPWNNWRMPTDPPILMPMMRKGAETPLPERADAPDASNQAGQPEATD